MRRERVFAVGLLGFADTEHRLIARILALSEARPRRYKPVNRASGADAHICLLNPDDVEAVREAEVFRRIYRHVPHVLVTAEPLESESYCIARPLTAARLFKLLDVVVDQEILARE